MPIINMKHLVSFSSEDSKHPAENILKPETYYKWKCASGSERHASVLLQLEKASQIHALDIGNNGSAFIEVLVGRSSWSSAEEFKVLLVASSFMTPAESKAGKDLTRVRMFSQGNFTKTVAEEKWDQVKIVCTQPYNQSEAYGLSFVKIHSPPEKEQEPQQKVVQLGRFKLKIDPDDEKDNISTGGFFQRRMSNPLSTPKPAPQLSIAASARSSLSSPKGVSTIFETKEEPSGNKQISLSHDHRQEVAAALLHTPIPNKSTKKENAFPKMKTHSDTPRRDVLEVPKRKVEKEHSSNDTPPAKKIKAAPKKRQKKKKKNVSFNKILEGVVFVLSGYENPERSNIRDMALSMGANYEPSWNNRCTHLICAFANTPKYNQVKGKGKIVRKTWFKDCHNNKRRMNTKNYRMDGGGDSSYESTSSEDDAEPPSAVMQTVESEQKDKDVPSANKDSPSSGKIKDVSPPVRKKSPSDCDTEDELEKIRELQKKEAEKTVEEERTVVTNIQTKHEEDSYSGTTEEEDNQVESNDVDPDTVQPAHSAPELPEFYDGKTFFFYGDFDVKDRRLLKRYITAYSGSVEEYMSDTVNYIISNQDWDENFQQALEENPLLQFLQPKWILKCHEKQKLIPQTAYEIKPS